MSYRSNVRSLIYGPEDEITALIADHQINHGNTLFEEFKHDLRRYKIAIIDLSRDKTRYQSHRFTALDLRCDDCKWCEDFPEVIAWETLLESAEDFKLNYEFIRVGEDYGDVDHRSIGDYNFLSPGIPPIRDNIPEEPNTDQPILAI